MGQIYTKEELEEFGDKVKSAVIRALANEGYLDGEVADRWSMRHTICLKRHRLFRSALSNWFGLHEKEVKEGSWQVLVMENVSTDIETDMDELHEKETGGQQELDLQDK